MKYVITDEGWAVRCENQEEVNQVVAIAPNPQVFSPEEAEGQTPWVVSAKEWLEAHRK